DIRVRAPQNVIVVPSLQGEQSLAGRMRIVDPAHRSDPQLAYGIHYPSLTRGIAFWDKTFGTASASIPVIVSEWDANSTTGCVPNAGHGPGPAGLPGQQAHRGGGLCLR